MLLCRGEQMEGGIEGLHGCQHAFHTGSQRPTSIECDVSLEPSNNRQGVGIAGIVLETLICGPLL